MIIPYLPEEILTNVLKRLPVKSLVRFRCVSRLWKNYINTPSFIIDHLSYSNHQIPYLITDFEGTSILYSLGLDMELRGVLDGHPTGSIKPDMIVGSCNGLLCVQTSQFDAVPPTLSLWNPAIREVMQVPRSRTVSGVAFCHLGFGFSPSLNDYKIVITYTDGEDDMISGVEVYSLATNSWKDIELGILEGRCLFDESESINVSGSIFWLAWKTDLEMEEGWTKDSITIVSFDLALEEFKWIPTPPIFTPPLSGEGLGKLTTYENMLALLNPSFAPNSSNFASDLCELWVLDEGINASWSKKFTFGPYPYSLEPLAICRNQIFGTVSYIDEDDEDDEDDDEEEDDDDIFLINLTSNEFKVIDGRRYGYTGRFFEYVESLLSPINIPLRNP